MKSSSKSTRAQRRTAKQSQRWGRDENRGPSDVQYDEDLKKAILMSLETKSSEDLANELASEEGDIADQGRRLDHFKRQKEQKEKREREQRQKAQREREAQKQKEQREKERERERERSREAQRSREKIKQERREKHEAERRIANKVREGLVDRAVRDRRAAIEIAKLNENLRAALQPGILGPFGVPKWPASGHKWPKDDDDDDDDDEEDGAFAFNTACQALSATGECDAHTMQRYPVSSVCWVHEAAPASAYGSMLSSIVEFWRKRPSEKHESKTKRLYQKVFQRYMDEGRTESPISIAAKVIGACIYVWGSVSGTTRWTVYHTETGECSLSSRAPVYLVMYATSTPGKYRYARIKPHTKGTTLPGSLVH